MLQQPCEKLQNISINGKHVNIFNLK